MKRFVIFLSIGMVFVSGFVFAQDATGSGPDENDPALYAVGALGASNLYTTYFLLGTLADGYATAAYTAVFADELARDIIGLNETSIEVLQRMLDETVVNQGDRALVQDMITAHELLIQQTWGLLAYVNDPADT
ncbi:MAG: hypothetical protein E4H09_03050, partial [Spirochaetales bacterium]